MPLLYVLTIECKSAKILSIMIPDIRPGFTVINYNW